MLGAPKRLHSDAPAVLPLVRTAVQCFVEDHYGPVVEEARRGAGESDGCRRRRQQPTQGLPKRHVSDTGAKALEVLVEVTAGCAALEAARAKAGVLQLYGCPRLHTEECVARIVRHLERVGSRTHGGTGLPVCQNGLRGDLPLSRPSSSTKRRSCSMLGVIGSSLSLAPSTLLRRLK